MNKINLIDSISSIIVNIITVFGVVFSVLVSTDIIEIQINDISLLISLIFLIIISIMMLRGVRKDFGSMVINGLLYLFLIPYVIYLGVKALIIPNFPSSSIDIFIGVLYVIYAVLLMVTAAYFQINPDYILPVDGKSIFLSLKDGDYVLVFPKQHYLFLKEQLDDYFEKYGSIDSKMLSEHVLRDMKKRYDNIYLFPVVDTYDLKITNKSK